MNNLFAANYCYLVLVSATILSLSACGKVIDSADTPTPKITIGTEIDDGVITSSVKAALIADPVIKGFDFRVETRKGEVLLSGFVDTQTQIDSTVTAARVVSGVKSVQNNVALKGARTTLGNEVDDGLTTAKVKAALVGDVSIKSSDIGVATRKGEVQLSGFVSSHAQMDRAMILAKGVEGVHHVSNDMAIKQ